MKTYKKTINCPRLVITYDESPMSPREWTNLGYFITKDDKYNSPDTYYELENIMKKTGDEATSQEEHIKMMTERINAETNEKVIAIYPVVKYEHSGVAYSLGAKHGFDNSNNGFYIITKESQKEIGVAKKDFEKVIKEELNVFNQYLNGEIYKAILYDDKGKEIDSCCGFYDIEDIKECLPEEWKDEELSTYFQEDPSDD
jgi:hypothetical protein